MAPKPAISRNVNFGLVEDILELNEVESNPVQCRRLESPQRLSRYPPEVPWDHFPPLLVRVDAETHVGLTKLNVPLCMRGSKGSNLTQPSQLLKNDKTIVTMVSTIELYHSTSIA